MLDFVHNKKNQVISLAVMILLMVATCYVIFKDQSPAHLLRVMSSVKLIYMLAGACLMIFYISCEGINIHISQKCMTGKSSFIRSLGYAFVGFYFSSITPSSTGGQPAQIFYMKRDGISISHSTLTLMVILITHQFVMLALALGTFLLNIGFKDAGFYDIRHLITYGIIANTLLVIFIIMVMRSRGLVEKIALGALGFLTKIGIVKKYDKWEASLEHLLDEYEDGANFIRKNPSMVIIVTIITFIQIIAMYSVPFVVYKAFGLNRYSFLQILYLQSVLNLAVSSIPIPGSVGASEGSFLKLFNKMFTQSLVVPAMLLTRLLNFYIILVISGIISYWLYIKKSFYKKL